MRFHLNDTIIDIVYYLSKKLIYKTKKSSYTHIKIYNIYLFIY